MGIRYPHYPGIIVYETKRLKQGADFVIPPRLYVAKDYRKYYGEAIIQHGFGHYLQFKKYGFLYYYFVIVPASVWSAIIKKEDTWCEKDANRLAHEFFGKVLLMGTKYFPL